MLCSFVTDLIGRKVQCGECLGGNKKNKRFDKEVGVLHCFVEEHWQDVAHLHHRSDCCRGREW